MIALPILRSIPARLIKEFAYLHHCFNPSNEDFIAESNMLSILVLNDRVSDLLFPVANIVIVHFNQSLFSHYWMNLRDYWTK